MKRPRFELYKDKAGEWRWRLRAANSRTIADSGEGYKRRSACLRAAWAVAEASHCAWTWNELSVIE